MSVFIIPLCYGYHIVPPLIMLRREAKKRSGRNCLLLLSVLKFLVTCRMFAVSNHSPADISKKCFAQMLITVRSGLNFY